MLDIRNQEKRISALKERLLVERTTAARQLRMLVPQTRKAAAVGTFAWGARKALPLLQPLLIALVRRRTGGVLGTRLIQAAGAAAFAFALWHMFRPSGNNEN